MRRASFTLSSEQQGRSGRSASASTWHPSRIVAPTTSYPCLTSRAAATDESTPPLIATSTRSRMALRRGEPAGLVDQRREQLGHARDARIRGEGAEAHADGRPGEVRGDAEGTEHVRGRDASALAGG